MRNLFDQYRHHENRLTHALVCCLAEEPKLMRSFLGLVSTANMPRSGKLHIVEQQLPGEPDGNEDDAERRGLPDAWIYSDNDWAILIESKVAAAIDIDQLKRHLATAAKRGFSAAQVVLISVATPKHLPPRCTHLYWADVYRWAIRERTVLWAARLADFMEITEGRMVSDEKPLEGTLTAFSGIHFDNENPYSYFEAKRILKLMMDELRKSPTLVSELGIDPLGEGRGAITGQDSNAVWNFLRLKTADQDGNFTKYPHLTLAIENDRVVAQATIPNGLDGALVRKLKASGYEAFKGLVVEFLSNACSIMATDQTATPIVIVVQRHYRSQRSVPVYDARLEFDPRTAIGGEDAAVKHQEQWLRASFDAFANRKSNVQIGIGMQFPYRNGAAVREATFVKLIEKSLLACKPFLAAMGLTPNR